VAGGAPVSAGGVCASECVSKCGRASRSASECRRASRSASESGCGCAAGGTAVVVAVGGREWRFVGADGELG